MHVILADHAVFQILGCLNGHIAACLDNVSRHVGEGAPAWVLLEDLGDRVEVSVRDEGPGIPDEWGLMGASVEAVVWMGITGYLLVLAGWDEPVNPDFAEPTWELPDWPQTSNEIQEGR